MLARHHPARLKAMIEQKSEGGACVVSFPGEKPTKVPRLTDTQIVLGSKGKEQGLLKCGEDVSRLAIRYVCNKQENKSQPSTPSAFNLSLNGLESSFRSASQPCCQTSHSVFPRHCSAPACKPSQRLNDLSQLGAFRD